MPQQNNNRELAVKIGLTILLSILFLVLLYKNMSGGGSGFISGLYYGHGSNMSSFITSVLVLAVKLLWLIFIICLIIGLAILVKKSIVGDRKANLDLRINYKDGYTCPCCSTRLTAEFKFCPNCKASLKDICKKCGKELQAGWACCPICGTEKHKH